MKKCRLELNYDSCSKEELSPIYQTLVEKAILATDNAYAGYSHFYVGAALLLANGDIVIGANQENAAFPSGLCAERTAVFAAQAQQPAMSIHAIAIAARNDAGLMKAPVTPCGACRQVMLEMEDRYHRDIDVILYGTDQVYVIHSVKDMLPFSFVDANMKDE